MATDPVVTSEVVYWADLDLARRIDDAELRRLRPAARAGFVAAGQQAADKRPRCAAARPWRDGRFVRCGGRPQAGSDLCPAHVRQQGMAKRRALFLEFAALVCEGWAAIEAGDSITLADYQRERGIGKELM